MYCSRTGCLENAVGGSFYCSGHQNTANNAKMTDMRTAEVRRFETGATRSPSDGKPEYAGYLHPSVIKAFGEYMLKHQTDSAGQRRDSRNHKKGIPAESYMQSMFRHFVDVWSMYEANTDAHNKGADVVHLPAEMIESLMALMFNVMGMASITLVEQTRPDCGER